MNDMTSTIIPRSDQLNSDDLLTGPKTIKVTGVTIRGGQEQPVSIHYDGDEGKPYKSCKSMNRVLVAAWGADASKYVGRSMTLYCDPKVKWAGMEVGGIRISHMSHIDSNMTMALTVTRGKKNPHIVRPLKTNAEPPQSASHSPVDAGSAPADGSAPNAAGQNSDTARPEAVLLPVTKSVPAAPNPVHAQINDALANVGSSLANRFAARLKAGVWGAKTVEELTPQKANDALAWINSEADK